MNRLLLFILLVSVSVVVSAQQYESRRGYVGMGIGVAIPHGDYDGDAGVQLNLVNAGYLFSKNVGMTSTLFGVAFPYDKNVRHTDRYGRYYDDDDEAIGLVGMMAGPMFSTATANGMFDFDLRLQGGFASGFLPDYMDRAVNTERPTSLALGAGASMRWNCWKYISVSLNYDFYSAKPNFGGVVGKVNMQSSGITMGVNFRFK